MMTEDQWLKLVARNSSQVGDDAAVFSPQRGREIVVCSDSLVEGVHFLLKTIAPEDLGWKSLAVNLSDLAAMGAAPQASLLNLSVPKNLMGPWSRRFLKGYRALSKKYGVELIGGDTTLSPRSVFISVTAIGTAKRAQVKFRSAARVGDYLCVSGPLGDSRAGLFLQKKNWKDPARKQLLKAHHRPNPRVAQGQWLGRQSSVGGMMDLSDGLLKDLNRLSSACGHTLEIQLEKIPTSTAFERFARHFRRNIKMEALSGGEDYELLFTCRAQAFQRLRKDYFENFGQTITQIGRVADGPAMVQMYQNGQRQKLNSESFEHF